MALFCKEKKNTLSEFMFKAFLLLKPFRDPGSGVHTHFLNYLFIQKHYNPLRVLVTHPQQPQWSPIMCLYHPVLHKLVICRRDATGIHNSKGLASNILLIFTAVSYHPKSQIG